MFNGCNLVCVQCASSEKLMLIRCLLFAVPCSLCNKSKRMVLPRQKYERKIPYSTDRIRVPDQNVRENKMK